MTSGRCACGHCWSGSRLRRQFSRPRRGDLTQVDGVGGEVARNLTRWREHIDLDAELARIEKSGVRVVTRDEADYPKNLKEIYDPPLVLYVQGRSARTSGWPLRLSGRGGRRCTGRKCRGSWRINWRGWASRWSAGWRAGSTRAPHNGALQAKGRTVAVIGCGIDTVYPPENKKLAEQIVEKGGAVVTEFPFGVKPDRQNFPMRNRIISGWSLGVVVVEANLKSGALITAAQAAEQGRQVFAVPGRADSILSRGTNKLIKDGAKLTEDVEDILSEFEYLLPRESSAEQSPQNNPSAAPKPLSGFQRRRPR